MIYWLITIVMCVISAMIGMCIGAWAVSAHFAERGETGAAYRSKR